MRESGMRGPDSINWRSDASQVVRRLLNPRRRRALHESSHEARPEAHASARRRGAHRRDRDRGRVRGHVEQGGVVRQHADQGGGPVRLPGRVRLVRRAGPGRRRLRDVGVRRGQAGQRERPAQGLDRRFDRRSPAQAGRDRLLERPGGHGHQGDQAAHGAARCRRDDRAAVRRRVDRSRELREAAPEQDVRRRLLGGAGHDPEGAGAELLPLPR